MRKSVIGSLAIGAMVAGWLGLEGIGLFLPYAGTPLLTIGNALALAQKPSPWTVEEETATAGPWRGILQMRYKPVPSQGRPESAYPHFDVVWAEQLQYHGLFPPVLLQWPDRMSWPKGVGGGSQGGLISPMRLHIGTFVYANYEVKDPDMPISLTQLHTVFDTATFDMMWRGFAAFPPTRLWSVGPVHTRILVFKTSLP